MCATCFRLTMVSSFAAVVPGAIVLVSAISATLRADKSHPGPANRRSESTPLLSAENALTKARSILKEGSTMQGTSPFGRGVQSGRETVLLSIATELIPDRLHGIIHPIPGKIAVLIDGSVQFLLARAARR